LHEADLVRIAQAVARIGNTRRRMHGLADQPPHPVMAVADHRSAERPAGNARAKRGISPATVEPHDRGIAMRMPGMPRRVNTS